MYVTAFVNKNSINKKVKPEKKNNCCLTELKFALMFSFSEKFKKKNTMKKN